MQAESNAIITLTENPLQTDSDAYVIELGADDNKKTTIGRVGETPTSVDTENILNGTEFREFWITMEDGKIEMGRGNTLGTGGFIEFDAPDANTITSISLTSSNSEVAEWSFPTVIGKLNNFYYTAVV